MERDDVTREGVTIRPDIHLGPVNNCVSFRSRVETVCVTDAIFLWTGSKARGQTAVGRPKFVALRLLKIPLMPSQADLDGIEVKI